MTRPGIPEGVKFAFAAIFLAGVALAGFWLSEGTRTAGPPAPPPTAEQQAVPQDMTLDALRARKLKEEQQAAMQQRDEGLKREREQRNANKLFLCQLAAACKKYSSVRLECATAGNFKTCLRIKMGDDAVYSGTCSGYREGEPAIALSPETPNAAECFLRQYGWSTK